MDALFEKETIIKNGYTYDFIGYTVGDEGVTEIYYNKGLDDCIYVEADPDVFELLELRGEEARRQSMYFRGRQDKDLGDYVYVEADPDVFELLELMAEETRRQSMYSRSRQDK